MAGKNTTYKFKKNASIGAMDASEDDKYLENCFIDTGYIEELTDPDTATSIVLGRTGSGKTALLETIKSTKDNIVDLQPEELALNYISNSNIIDFFEKIGVDLDLFYQLLWRHVLTVELIRKRYGVAGKSSFFNTLSDVFKKDKSKKEAIDYLEKYGGEFWQESDVRMKELTTKLEEDLSSSVDLKAANIGSLSGKAASNLSTEMREEITNRAQSIVNRVQIRKLNKVIALLSEDVFSNKQHCFYILIDRLDENWVDSKLKNDLIRALIESIKTFRKIRPVKIILSLRTDLLSRVFDKTRSSGFQEEKYEDYILRIKWEKDELRNLLDKRINSLIREEYTKQGATFTQIFQGKPYGESSIDFLLKRTLMRPRDAISFTNECLTHAHGKAKVTSQILKNAEKQYSKKRFNALLDEWIDDYPLLKMYCSILPKKTTFKHSDFTKESIETLALDLSIEKKNDPVKDIALEAINSNKSFSSFRNIVLQKLYRVGIIGAKRTSYTSTEWSYEDEPTITESEVKNSQLFDIHPMLWRYFGVYTDVRKKSTDERVVLQ